MHAPRHSTAALLCRVHSRPSPLHTAPQSLTTIANDRDMLLFLPGIAINVLMSAVCTHTSLSFTMPTAMTVTTNDGSTASASDAEYLVSGDGREVKSRLVGALQAVGN